MKKLSLGQSQRGYLLEIPILLVLAIVILSIVIPHLNKVGQKIAAVIGAIPVLFALFYMIVTPGWMPGDRTRLKPPWSWIVFLLVAIPVIAVVVMIVFG